MVGQKRRKKLGENIGKGKMVDLGKSQGRGGVVRPETREPTIRGTGGKLEDLHLPKGFPLGRILG